MADLTKLIDALAHLLGVLVWPGLLVYFIIEFGPKIAPELLQFLRSLRQGSFKGFGIDVTWQAEAADYLAAAGNAQATAQIKVAEKLAATGIVRADVTTTPEVQIDHAKEAAQIVEEISPSTFRLARGARILWVDDRPNNNILERKALEALGINFVLSLSTDDALEKIKTQWFDVIISDMGRPPDARAGYTLLDKLRPANRTPFIIYAGSQSPEHQAEARQHGAMGCANRAAELFEMVLEALRRQRP